MPNAGSPTRQPKLFSVLQEGYSSEMLRQDAQAGLTVAIVALPLSMAIAVASGVTPERGLYAAIVGGFIVSALGGSRFQIGGPAGAFIVLVSATVSQYGLQGLIVTVMVSGILLAAAGILRVGSLVRHVPHAVAVGFTSAIAIIILTSQLRDLLGLTLHGAEPSALLPKLSALAQSLSSFNPASLSIGTGAVVLIVLLRKWQPTWPAMLIALVASSLSATLLHRPVETIGARFGALPAMLPPPHLPQASWTQILTLLPGAFSFTLLGGVESLLSARVADGMTGRQHRPNVELIAQGVANVASALFGGIAITGAIARTATNVRAGARTPVAGMLHAGFLLALLFVAAPLASYIPLAALAGLLLVVCWDMSSRQEFVTLLHHRRSAAILLCTFLLTLLTNLTIGILAGWLLSWSTGLIASLAARRPG